MVHVWAIQHTACIHFYGHTHTWKAQFFEHLSHPFWLSSRESCCLSRLIFKLPSGSELILFGRWKWKEIISISPCAFLPKDVLNLACFYFLCSDRCGSFLLFPASSYFWHPWSDGGVKQLSIFCPQSVGKNYLILEVCPLPSFIPSLHKHKKRRGEIFVNNTRQDWKIAVWISPRPVRLKWYYMSCRQKYSWPKEFLHRHAS